MVDNVDALVFINNAVSADLARRMLERDGIAPDRVALVQLRDVRPDWASECAEVIAYGRRPEQRMLGQRHFVTFFLRGASLLRRLRRANRLREVYVPNNDNLLTNPMFRWKDRGAPFQLTVVAEGIMNYQRIGQDDRAAWRWRVKPSFARALGLPYASPRGHLSGADEPATDRVVSFTAHGLVGPTEKVVVLPLPRVEPAVPADAGTCLLLHTGLWQWMPADAYERFGRAFAEWVAAQGFDRILAKPHPRVATGDLERWLPDHELLADPRSAEAMAAELPAATVVGTCCTALATLKLMRPDLRCIDFGADFYCEHAYGGDVGVIGFLEGAGVEVHLSGLQPSDPT